MFRFVNVYDSVSEKWPCIPNFSIKEAFLISDGYGIMIEYTRFQFVLTTFNVSIDRN